MSRPDGGLDAERKATGTGGPRNRAPDCKEGGEAAGAAEAEGEALAADADRRSIGRVKETARLAGTFEGQKARLMRGSGG